MKVVNDIKNYRSDKKSILTIGTFDGIHIGHQKILKSLVAQAKKENLLANVLTFFPHPRMVLQKESQIKLIDTLKEREDFLRKLGVDNLIIHPFSVAFSKLTALEFIQNILVKLEHGLLQETTFSLCEGESLEKKMKHFNNN